MRLQTLLTLTIAILMLTGCKTWPVFSGLNPAPEIIKPDVTIDQSLMEPAAPAPLPASGEFSDLMRGYARLGILYNDLRLRHGNLVDACKKAVEKEKEIE